MLQQLPAAHLTQLHAELDMRDADSMAAVQALTNLRSRCMTQMVPQQHWTCCIGWQQAFSSSPGCS
jgi:hypothetical protein